MTVNELIEKLQAFKTCGLGNEQVMYAYPSGDYWRNTIAGEVDVVRSSLVKHSTYHEKFVVVTTLEDDDETVETPAGMIEVVILEFE